MYEIRKRFDFSASHQLHGLPEGHQCARLHGHNYQVEIVLQCESLDDRGFIVDYGDLSPFRSYLDNSFEHRHLNDVLPQPTAEHLAAHFYEWCKVEWSQVVEVRVSETPKTWASYRKTI